MEPCCILAGLKFGKYMQKHSDKIVTIFGGTGFLGRHVVRKLAARGMCVRVATRVPESAYKLKVSGDVGQIVAVACDYNDEQSVAAAIRGSDMIVNCIGILFERGKKRTFQRVHVEIPSMIARSCMDEGVKRFVHVSALGCNAGISRYARSKLEGEKVVRSYFPKATIIRPGVIFGADDNFFNMLAEMMRYAPFVPLIGGGRTRLQPVFVGDVATAVVQAVDAQTDKHLGVTYQLGGPETITFRDVYVFILKYTQRKQKLRIVPYKLAKCLAWFMEFLPHPMLTRDQVNSLKTNSVVTEGAPDFRSFGIKPKSIHLVVPEYIERFRDGGAISKFKTAS
jgi:NADH dehydrogenase